MRPKIILQEELYNALSVTERAYVQQSADAINQDYKRNFNQLFSCLARKLANSKDQLVTIDNAELKDNLLVHNWTVLRLARVFLISLIQDEEEAYCQFIENLFQFGDLQELVALYSALPILSYPERWIERCQEGVRSNMGFVQEAIIEQNKYPARYLSENAWNQLVLKSFFTGKNVLRIEGLFERNNKALATSIVDYIYERHSAKRNIHPILWLLAKDNLPARALHILLKVFNNTANKLEQSILFHVLLTNEDRLYAFSNLNELTTLPEDIIPFSEEVLEAYKNGELCVQN